MAEDLKQLMQENFLSYASYVILERAIPNVDGFKPVQRRILHTLQTMDDGKFHKVANAAGQTMAYHPHGDAPIVDALVNMANKGFFLDTQGNFGNLYTGDPASAARYIETRLSPLAKEALFNADITDFIPSYDGRNKEPIILPSKIPVLLMQGSEGIAVGMSTRILPHNFAELLEAQIAILESRPFQCYPDFITGGLVDVSEYNKGAGKVKLRVKMETPNDKTIIIREICYGTTTESLIQSIDDAAKKGKIRIDSINDYTAEKVEIEIKLPRGQHAENIIDALYAFTECEVTIHSRMLVIKDNRPWETTVDEFLELQTETLKAYLKREQEIEQERLLEKIFAKTLEQIFIEKRIYKKIEEISSLEEIHQTIATALKPYHKTLLRIPTHEDRERLLNIPIRRISRFDIQKNEDDIQALEDQLSKVEKNLKNIKAFTIHYLKDLIKKYGKDHPRRTQIREIEELDIKALARKTLKVGIDLEKGYVGTKVDSGHSIECSNFDKLLLLSDDGSFRVIHVPEKQYIPGGKLIYAGIADKSTVIGVIYRDAETNFAYAKRFVVKQFILEKEYRYFDEGMKLEQLTTQPDVFFQIQFKPKARQKVKSQEFCIDGVAIKGYGAKGVRIANKEVKKVKILEKKTEKA